MLIHTCALTLSLSCIANPTACWAESSPAQTPAEKLSPTRREPGLDKDTFNPVGKSFVELMLEAKRASDRKDYAKVERLMEYALTLENTRLQIAVLLLNRGIAVGLLGDWDAALKDFDQSLRFNPRLIPAYLNRGLASMKKNEIGSAMRDFDRAIEIDPSQWESYESRARAFGELHRWPEALKNASKALELNPKSASPYATRARIEVRCRQLKQALADAETAIRLDKENVVAYAARADVHILLRQDADVEGDLKTLQSLDPRDPATKDNFVGWVRATCMNPAIRNGKEAVALAKRACEECPWKEPRYIDTLAAAYAEAGDFDSAARYQTEVLKLNESSPPPNEKELRQRLELYQKHQPYRDELKP